MPSALPRFGTPAGGNAERATGSPPPLLSSTEVHPSSPSAISRTHRGSTQRRRPRNDGAAAAAAAATVAASASPASRASTPSANVPADPRAASLVSASDFSASMSVAVLPEKTLRRSRCSWRLWLWSLLFPADDAVGVEGAATHYAQVDAKRSGLSDAASEEEGHDSSLRLRSNSPTDPLGEPALGTVCDSRHRSSSSVMEPWHHIQLPLSRVVLFLRLRQRLADQWDHGCWYTPFFLALVLFVMMGPGTGHRQLVLDVDAIQRETRAQSSSASDMKSAVLLEAFRLDTESVSPTTANNSAGNFLSGNSASYPWMHSWYNASINAWTPQSNPQPAVDAQVERVAAEHHQPVYLRLTSVRTRRDMLRWLQLQLVPRLWDCRNPGFVRPWRTTVTGSHYTLGAVRFISRRYAQRPPDVVSGVSVTAAVNSAADAHVAAVVTPLLSDALAVPPLIPSAICHVEDDVVSSPPPFSFDNTIGGYVALMPFATSCTAVRSVLALMETPKKRVLWPPAYNTSVLMQDLWRDYTETDRGINESVAAAAASCPSFLFDPSVAEVLVQYVLYGEKTNQYTVVEIKFTMPSEGAVVRPHLSTFSLSALRWSSSFTSLALSIVLSLTILFYGHYLLMRMAAQYAAKMSHIPRPRRTHLQQMWCALTVLFTTQNLVHVVALVLAAAAVGFWWHALVQLTSVSRPTYTDSDRYPEAIDRIVRHGGRLLARLSGGALFFAGMGIIRFASVTPGLWVCVQTLVGSVPRLCLIFGVWMMVNVGVAMMAVLLYGSALVEFRTFGSAFTMLIFMILDGGRSLMNGFAMEKETGNYAILPSDDSLPGIRGSRLGRTEPVPLDYRSVTLALSTVTATPLFLLFFYYFQGLVMMVWGTLTMVEEYRSVMLLPEAEALPLWRGMWELRFASLSRIANGEYLKEVVRRVLLAREEAVMLTDVEYALQLGCARAAAAPAASAAAATARDSPPLASAAAAEPGVSLTMVLWLVPRDLQIEYGAAHLRLLWYTCVASVLRAQHDDKPWKPVQWRQHWQQQSNSLSGWLRASVPANDTLEEQAARVGVQLEELPHSVVKYVEGKFM